MKQSMTCIDNDIPIHQLFVRRQTAKPIEDKLSGTRQKDFRDINEMFLCNAGLLNRCSGCIYPQYNLIFAPDITKC